LVFFYRIRYNDLCCRLCQMFRPPYTFWGSTYPQKQKSDTHHEGFIPFHQAGRFISETIYYFKNIKRYWDVIQKRKLQGMVERKITRTRFVSWHDRIFILFLLVTWPEYLFLKNKFQIPFRIKWPSPKKHIGGPRDEQRKLQDMVERKITRTNLEMLC
jgi:hypothetical protein